MTKATNSTSNRLRAMTVVTVTLLFGGMTAYAGPAQRVQDAIWAHGELYDTVLTDTSFRTPPQQSTDTIYNFSMSGLSGQRSISNAAPGDRDYNGGRWSVKVVVFTEEGLEVHDPDGDGVVNFELTSEEELIVHAMLGHLTIMDTSIYFECPMLPSR